MCDFSLTPLHKACWKGNVDVVELLLEHNANIHARIRESDTCLHEAACAGHIEVFC